MMIFGVVFLQLQAETAGPVGWINLRGGPDLAYRNRTSRLLSATCAPSGARALTNDHTFLPAFNM